MFHDMGQVAEPLISCDNWTRRVITSQNLSDL